MRSLTALGINCRRQSAPAIDINRDGRVVANYGDIRINA